jgi:lipopolysaccharide export system permease protein
MVTTVVAPRGEFFYDPAHGISHLRLYDGIINQLGEGNVTAHFVRFNTYDFRLDAENLTSRGRSRKKGRKEMTLPELRSNLAGTLWKGDEYRAALIQYHEGFSIPFACFVLGLMAVPLGIQSRSARRSFGVIVALFFFLLYYALLSMGLALSETGRCHPAIGMWLPNAVLGGLAVYLLAVSTRERPVGFLSKGLRVFQRLGSIGGGR